MGQTFVAEAYQVDSCDHSTRLALLLGLVVSLAVTGCGRDSGISESGSEPMGDVLLQFAAADGEPAAADLLDVDILEDGNTIDTRHGIPQDSRVLLEDVSTRADEVHVLAREGGRVVAESYRALSVPEGETAAVEVVMVARSCQAPGTVAKEAINMLNLVTVIAGGDEAISDEDWPAYEPSPPFSKNSDRHLLFVDSCFYRSFSDSWDCSGEDCFTYVPHDGYSWLRLARTEHVETIPASENTDRVPPPGYVQIVVFEKCQELVFEDQIWEMHDPYGKVYVMHANPDGVPDTVTPTLPKGWHIRTAPTPSRATSWTPACERSGAVPVENGRRPPPTAPGGAGSHRRAH